MESVSGVIMSDSNASTKGAATTPTSTPSKKQLAGQALHEAVVNAVEHVFARDQLAKNTFLVRTCAPPLTRHRAGPAAGVAGWRSPAKIKVHVRPRAHYVRATEGYFSLDST